MEMPEEAQVSMVEDDGAVTIIGGGILTYATAQEFSDALSKAALSADEVTVDFRPAKFIDTQVVHDLGKAAVKLGHRGKRLKVIVSASEYPLEVLKMSCYDRIMDIEVE
jgi:anti-anti-sigma regulatory factor